MFARWFNKAVDWLADMAPYTAIALALLAASAALYFAYH